MTTKSRHWLFCLLTAFLTLWTAPVSAGESDAINYAASIGDQALEILSGDAGDDLKQQRLEQLFVEIVDTDWIGRFVLGQSWRKLNPAQRQDYLDTYRRFLVKHYTSNFKEYTEGTTFKVTRARPIGNKNQYLVSVAILRVDNPQPVNIDYRLRQTGEIFRAIDIVVEGVSLLATQRSEFASVIQRDGLEKLLALLRKKAS